MASYRQGQLFEDEEDSVEDEEEWGPMKIRGPGYTPFQFVPISDEQIKHEVSSERCPVCAHITLTFEKLTTGV